MSKGTTFVFALLGLFALCGTAGCSNPIVLPRTARLSVSSYGGDYPFMLTVEAYQLMRLNVHTFEGGHEKVPVTYQYYEVDRLGGIERVTIRGSMEPVRIASVLRESIFDAGKVRPALLKKENIFDPALIH